MVTFLVGISWGGNGFPWQSAETLVPVFIGAAGLIITLFYEHRYAKSPFLKKVLFRDASASTVYILGLLQGFILYGQLYYVPFYFLSVKQKTPTMAGVAMLPVTALLVPGSIISGVLVSRLNAYRWSIWMGWALVSIALGLFVSWNVDTHLIVSIVTLAIAGIGHGLILNAQTFVTGAIVDPHNSGHAAAMYLFMRMLGSAIGVNVGSTTFQNVMVIELKRKGISRSIAQHAEEYLDVLQTLPDDTFKNAVLSLYAFGFKGVYGVYVALAAVAFAASFFIRHYDLNKDHKPDHRLDRLDGNRLVGNPGPSGPGSSH
ncbi:major facilitator superfamily domain-containing protein [Colletotrichum cereale]|nr:major facilitator superfamily domain-containing protein [Colletotrichum cereale]